jgi:subtilase family serine protease
LDGTGQTAALVEFDGYYQGDITKYEQTPTNQLPAVPLTNILVDGFSGTPGSENKEVAVDIEMLISMAPRLSRIIVYEAQLLESEDDILNQIATDNAASQISCSWIIAIDATGDQIFQQYAAQGQSFFEASGGTGAYPSAL